MFSAVPRSTAGPAQIFGGHAKGCAAGLVQLSQSGPTWQVVRLSPKRHWGHPLLVSFVIGLSRATRRVGWLGLDVCDMSQPRSGVMQTGHANHQLGLDVDIWMLPPANLNL